MDLGSLRGRIGRPGTRPDTGDGRDQNNRSAAGRLQMGNGGLGEAHGMPSVELERGSKVLRRGIQKVATDSAAGIRHGAVQAAEPLCRFVDRVSERLRVGDIDSDLDDAGPVPVQISTGAVQLLASTREDCDVGTSAANVSAMALPIPRLAPVTTKRRPLKPRSN